MSRSPHRRVHPWSPLNWLGTARALSMALRDAFPRGPFVAVAVAVGVALAPEPALAAPYVGEGFAPVGDDVVAAHRLATRRAREAALASAMAAMGTSAEIQAQILKGYATWTAAYRVLGQGNDGATARVQVEVEIDAGRLAKAIQRQASASASAPAPTPAAPLPVLDPRGGQNTGCVAGIRTTIGGQLIAQGVVTREGPGPAVTLDVRCTDLGRVPYAGRHGGRVELIVRGAGTSVLAAVAETAFVPITGETRGASAVVAAANRAALGAARTMAAARAGAGRPTVRLVLESGPAERVRWLETRLRESVMGVSRVSVHQIAGDGSVVLEVVGSLSAQQLADAIGGSAVKGATVEIVSVTAAEAASGTPGQVRVRLTS